MPEQGGVVSQQVLLHARELGQPERQATVVAEGAKVAEVVRDAFALEQQRAQPERPFGHFARRGGLQRHGIGPGKCHAAVAGDARREPGPFLQRQRFEAFLDAFMRVPKALFQPQDALADHREAEMPGLDDAGMHRTDGDLVHPLALDRNEGIAWIARREARVERHIAAQGESVLAPCPMPQPAARVTHSSAQPHQIRDRALHPARGRKEVRNIRIGLAIETNIDANQPFEGDQDGVQHKSCAAIALVARPEGTQPPPAARHCLAHASQSVAVHRRTPGRDGARQRREPQASDARWHALNQSDVPPGGTSRPAREV